MEHSRGADPARRAHRGRRRPGGAGGVRPPRPATRALRRPRPHRHRRAGGSREPRSGSLSLHHHRLRGHCGRRQPPGRERRGGGALGPRRPPLAIRDHRWARRHDPSRREAPSRQPPRRAHRMKLSAERRGAAAAMRRARDLGAASAAVFMTGDGLTPRRRAQAIVEGAILGTYRFDRYLKEKSEKVIQSVAVVEPERRNHAAAREGLRLGEIWAGATCLARDFVNEPANVMTPTYLAGRAEEIAKAGGLELKVLERAECAKLAMGAYLGGAQGSQDPPKVIHLIYAPGRRPRRRVAVIGKGITFDSRGLDLKTADGMLRMKDDMAGAATVLGVFEALPRLKLPIEGHGLIAATENMPSGTAQRPGDIVRAMNGLTIEIGNTDAEGRLTLADALAYAAQEAKPDEMIDLATLTGAVVTALGQGMSGLLASHDRLAAQLLAAAEAAGERMWRLPLFEEYKEGLKSDVADLTNVSSQ